MGRLTTGAGIAALAVIALSACAQPADVSTAHATTPPSASPLDLGQFTPAPSGAVDEDTGEAIEPRPEPGWDERSREAAKDAATTAMAAFARPDADFDTWWAELSPLLTQQAQQDYAYVDPANVPARAVTGSPAVVDETSAYVAFVEVPTDAGAYTLVLTRADGASPWLTSRFTPPEGTG